MPEQLDQIGVYYFLLLGFLCLVLVNATGFLSLRSLHCPCALRHIKMTDCLTHVTYCLSMTEKLQERESAKCVVLYAEIEQFQSQGLSRGV